MILSYLLIIKNITIITLLNNIAEYELSLRFYIPGNSHLYTICLFSFIQFH